MLFDAGNRVGIFTEFFYNVNDIIVMGPGLCVFGAESGFMYLVGYFSGYMRQTCIAVDGRVRCVAAKHNMINTKSFRRSKERPDIVTTPQIMSYKDDVPVRLCHATNYTVLNCNLAWCNNH